MGKSTIIVVIYSLVLLVLFGVFCYLMSIVDPPPLKDATRSRKFDSGSNDELLYPSEILQPDDNVAYGLEKVDYDAIDVHDKLSNLSSYRISDAPKIISVQKTNVKNYKTISNSSKKENESNKMTTTKSNLAKGYRRSIREKPNLLNSKLMSLLLNIKLFNGQPRVEIKVLDDLNEDKTNETQTFVGKMKPINFSDFINNDTRNVRELVQDETLLVQFVGNLTNLNETSKLNISKKKYNKENLESVSELVLEIINSNKTSKDHVLDLPNNRKTGKNVTTKSDKFSEIKEKYEINVTSAMPTELNNLKVSKMKTKISIKT